MFCYMRMILVGLDLITIMNSLFSLCWFLSLLVLVVLFHLVADI